MHMGEAGSGSHLIWTFQGMTDWDERNEADSADLHRAFFSSSKQGADLPFEKIKRSLEVGDASCDEGRWI